MTVNVVVQISGQVGGQIIGHAVKILEGFPKSGRLISHRLNADHRARRPLDIWPEAQSFPVQLWQ